MDKDILAICRQLKPIIGRKADQLWRYYITSESPSQRFEANTIIRQLGFRHLGGTVDSKKILLPPPPSTKSGILLGSIRFGNNDVGKVHLLPSDFRKHICIVGTTGSGKTNLCFNILDDLIDAKIPTWIVDWKRSYRNILTQRKGIKIFTIGRNASSFEWNPLIPPKGTDPQSWFGVVSEVLERSHISGQGVADVLLENIEQLIANGYDLHKITFQEIKNAIQRIKYPGRKGLWQQSCLRILRSLTYGAAKLFNSTNSVQLETLLDQTVIFELDMSLQKNVRTFFMEILVRWIHAFRLGQGESDNLRHVLILEEVHNVVQGNLDTANPLESVFRELRSFGQGAIAITQHPSLLPIWLLGNVHTVICFSLTHEADIEAARKAFFLQREESRYFDLLRVGQGIAKIKSRGNPYHIKIPKSQYKLGKTTDQEVRQHRETYMD